MYANMIYDTVSSPNVQLPKILPSKQYSSKLGDSPANLLKSTKMLMAAPQGRRLGYHTPDQVSNHKKKHNEFSIWQSHTKHTKSSTGQSRSVALKLPLKGTSERSDISHVSVGHAAHCC